MSARMPIAAKKPQAPVAMVAGPTAILPGTYQRNEVAAPLMAARAIRNVRMTGEYSG